jgi:ATP synthase subunit 6
MISNFLIYSPLEQFDDVSWVFFNNVNENFIPYISLYISEFDNPFGWYLYQYNDNLAFNIKNITFSFPTFWCGIPVYILIIILIKKFALVLNVYIIRFFFFLIGVHFFSGFLFFFWFNDLFIDNGISFIRAPQINLSFFLDENLITFLIAFFFFGGSEENDDENFLLEEEESDFLDDIVAPLFVANLGKNVKDNGPLYLKVLSVFGFVLINNLIGMLPYSDTGTSSLILTFWVALSVFASLIFLMIKTHGINYFFNLFMPSGCPLPLIFLLIPIEFISYSFRLVSLSVRLFANMMAGHTLLKVIVGFSWTMILLGDFFLIANLFPILILFVLTFMELGVAIIQAYVFTILVCMYLKDIFVSH